MLPLWSECSFTFTLPLFHMILYHRPHTDRPMEQRLSFVVVARPCKNTSLQRLLYLRRWNCEVIITPSVRLCTTGAGKVVRSLDSSSATAAVCSHAAPNRLQFVVIVRGHLYREVFANMRMTVWASNYKGEQWNRSIAR